MPAAKSIPGSAAPPFPILRFGIAEAAQMLRMSRAQLYVRISDGAIKPQKEGARTYITRAELDRYVAACKAASADTHR